MREKLNENPLAQAGIVAALLIVAILALTMMGGGGESESGGEAEAPATAASAPAEIPAEGTATAAAVPPSTTLAPPITSPPPKEVTAAWKSGETVVLMIVREGGIDDRMVKADADALSSLPGVALFVVPSDQIARYAAITEGAGVNRVPALVVLRPKALSQGVPTASVSYGYQDTESVVQQVIDARYKGRTLSYHP